MREVYTFDDIDNMKLIVALLVLIGMPITFWLMTVISSIIFGFALVLEGFVVLGGFIFILEEEDFLNTYW